MSGVAHIFVILALNWTFNELHHVIHMISAHKNVAEACLNAQIVVQLRNELDDPDFFIFPLFIFSCC